MDEILLYFLYTRNIEYSRIYTEHYWWKFVIIICNLLFVICYFNMLLRNYFFSNILSSQTIVGTVMYTLVLSSPFNSSSDFPLVSGIREVANTPINMNTATIINNWGMKAPGPPLSFNEMNPSNETMAPTFPNAAAIPWQVALNLVGNNSPGMMKHVALGPNV